MTWPGIADGGTFARHFLHPGEESPFYLNFNGYSYTNPHKLFLEDYPLR